MYVRFVKLILLLLRLGECAVIEKRWVCFAWRPFAGTLLRTGTLRTVVRVGDRYSCTTVPELCCTFVRGR